MKPSLSSIVAGIGIKRSAQPSLTVVLLEGESDRKLFGKLFSPETNFVVLEGKEKVLAGRDELIDKELWCGVICILDQDFDGIEGRLLVAAGVFYTDHHDLEIMLLDSAALQAVLQEKSAPEKWKSFSSSNKDPLTFFLEKLAPLAALRLHNERKDLGFPFRQLRSEEGNAPKLKFATFVNKGTLAVEVPALIQKLKNKSQQPALDEAEIEVAVHDILAEGHSPYLLCHGHDGCSLIGLALEKLIGTEAAAEVRGGKIESALRMAYRIQDFQLTALYQALLQWQNTHSPFVLFEQTTTSS